MSIPGAIVVLSLSLMSIGASGAITRVLVEIPTRTGVTQQFLFVTPEAPAANLVVARGFGTYPDAIHNGGPDPPFVRLLAEQGFAVALVDAPSDRLGDFILPPAFRRSDEHVADILAVIRYMQQHADVPIWLFSESIGTISVVNLALKLPADVRVGAIIGSGTTTGENSLLLMPLASLRLPTLLVAHTADACFLSPPANQPVLLAALTAVPVKELIFLSGGLPSADPCDKGAHEFAGLDAELTAAIVGFVDKHNDVLGGRPLLPRLAIEFYHSGLDHYFITDRAPEINDLDTGVHTGWTRTTRSFNVYTTAGPGTSPVCRFRIPPESGDSHFYGRGTTECDETARKFPTFFNEDPQFFHVILPVLGVCPAGTINVYRVFSNRPGDANHRYTIDPAIRDLMASMQPHPWTIEGDGENFVVMCLPQ